MVVSHEMEQPMQREAVNIGFETQRGRFARLIICSLGRNQNIAEIAVVAAEREYVCWLVEAAIVAIVPASFLSVINTIEKGLPSIPSAGTIPALGNLGMDCGPVCSTFPCAFYCLRTV